MSSRYDYIGQIEKIATKKKSKFQRYKDNKVELTPEEKKIVREKGAVWNSGSPDGNLAVWKSVDKNGETTYITHTHRAYNTAPTLKGAISRFHNFIKSTASEATDYEIEKIATPETYVCQVCGKERDEDAEPHCKKCGHDHTIKKKDYKKEIEKIARKLLDEKMVGDTINRHLTAINPDIVDGEVSESRVHRNISFPWNENIEVRTYLKDKNNQVITSAFYSPDDDGPIVSNLVRKGIPFSSKTRSTIVVPNEIRLKDQYKGKGIGTNAFFAIENAGKELGANKLMLVPDDEGSSVWVKDKFGLSISNEDKKDFNKFSKRYYKKKYGTKPPKSLRLSDHDAELIGKFLNNGQYIFLEKDINKKYCRGFRPAIFLSYMYLLILIHPICRIVLLLNLLQIML